MTGEIRLPKTNRHIQWIIQDVLRFPEEQDRYRFDRLPPELTNIKLKSFVIYCSYAKRCFLRKVYIEK